jgi:hypothetical protein
MSRLLSRFAHCSALAPITGNHGFLAASRRSNRISPTTGLAILSMSGTNPIVLTTAKPRASTPGKTLASTDAAASNVRPLGSGMVKGIGPVYAARLVSAFGAAVFDTIERTPRATARG